MTENKKYPENYAEEGSYVFCPVCGDKVPAGARFCTSCGSSLAGASNMEDVYGGPEYFETKNKTMGRVYAGPEPVNKKDEAISGVYAGPEYFEIKEQPMAILYAGPEYFGRNSGDSDEKQEDEKQADEQMFSGVYAGPKPVKGIISKIKDKLEK